MVRVAAYIHQMPEAIDMIEDAHKKDMKPPATSWQFPRRRNQTLR